MVRNYIVHHLFLLCFLSFCSFPFHYNYFYVVLTFYFIQIIKLFLSQLLVLPFFPLILLSIPPGEVWVSSCLVLSCQLGLNHSMSLGVLQGQVRRTRDCVTGDLVWFWLGKQAYGSFILSFYWLDYCTCCYSLTCRKVTVNTCPI